MSTLLETVCEIEVGDSNEVCLAKTMEKIHELWNTDNGFLKLLLAELVKEGFVYASEVLNARE